MSIGTTGDLVWQRHFRPEAGVLYPGQSLTMCPSRGVEDGCTERWDTCQIPHGVRAETGVGGKKWVLIVPGLYGFYCWLLSWLLRAVVMIPPSTEIPAPTEPPEPTPAPDSGISSLEEIKNAVIQVEAQGSFVDPGVGLQMNMAGTGSGFIIDESGIAVTNNHVVTGAAFLQVWVGGGASPAMPRSWPFPSAPIWLS